MWSCESDFEVAFVMRAAGCAPRLAQVLGGRRQRIWGSMGMTQSLLGDKDCWLQARLRATHIAACDFFAAVSLKSWW